ncbi:M48 family metalloprotease [Myxococcota bacterium]|nr:M48 family metalloprotease [Myxococcota bacterium]
MPSPSRRRLVLFVIFCGGLLAFSACSSPPKRNKPTVLMTEYDDSRVGQDAAVNVASQIGILDSPQLNAYVSRIGHKLLRGIPRRSFRFQFSVVDQEEPNAFALPGGYIFVSRGLLALAENEDELACVLGHEITHVTQRHAAAQQALATRGLMMPWIRAGKTAAYGRNMERDADKRGQLLCAAAGYDPMAMSTFLARLEKTERFRAGYSRNPGWLDTHPGSKERASVNAVRAREIRWRRDPRLGDSQASLYAEIEGLPIGQRPQAGVFHGDLFLHPDLDFSLRFPNGWYTQNTNSAVGAQEPRGRAIVFLASDGPTETPQQSIDKWQKKNPESDRTELEDSRQVKIGKIDAWRIKAKVRNRITSYVTFIPYREGTWLVTATSRSSDEKSFLGRTLATARSFRPLTPKERASIVQSNLHIESALPRERIDQLVKRTGSSWDVRTTALYNGIFIDHRFDGGESVKIVKTTPYETEASTANPAPSDSPTSGP